MHHVLVTGAFGQIGTELTRVLRARHGADAVLATGRRVPVGAAAKGPVERLDVTDGDAVAALVAEHEVGVIYHLAAILSAVAERDPQLAWRVNLGGLEHVLEAARLENVGRVFWPSSIAVFGPETPRRQVPQDTVMRPTTIYGVSKVAGELLADYYVHHYGLDVRGVRYPGVISSGAPPGGGTTDYAVEIFFAAVREGRYTAFVREDTVLPMIYIPDCIDAALTLMEADFEALMHHNGFNLAGVSFSVGELAAEIRRHLPDFVCDYAPDARQAIADTWPESLDDGVARAEWCWAPRYGLQEMVVDMLVKVGSEGDEKVTIR